MAKRTSSYVCQNCGAVYQRWQGKCDACGEWNSIAEETSAIAAVPASQRSRGRGRVFALETLTGATDEAPRLVSGIAELDRVTGGGFVRGSVLLLGGDPGIGKSTLLIQTCASLARSGVRAVYISAKKLPRRYACGQIASDLPTHLSSSRPRRQSRTSSPHWSMGPRPVSSSSIRSKPCGPIPWNPRQEP
jgi:predicted ATP-dependent serine protease